MFWFLGLDWKDQSPATHLAEVLKRESKALQRTVRETSQQAYPQELLFKGVPDFVGSAASIRNVVSSRIDESYYIEDAIERCAKELSTDIYNGFSIVVERLLCQERLLHCTVERLYDIGSRLGNISETLCGIERSTYQIEHCVGSPLQTAANELLSIGNIKLRSRELEDALKYFHKANDTYEVSPSIHQALAELYLYGKDATSDVIDFEKAEHHFRKEADHRISITKDPQFGDIYIAKAYFRASIASYQQAEECKKTAIETLPKLTPSIWEGDFWDETNAQLTEVIKRNLRDADRKFRGSEDLIEKALAYHPKPEPRYQSAIRDLIEKALAYHNDVNAEYHYSAFRYFASHIGVHIGEDPDDYLVPAREHLKKAIQLDRRYAVAVYLDQGINPIHGLDLARDVLDEEEFQEWCQELGFEPKFVHRRFDVMPDVNSVMRGLRLEEQDKLEDHLKDIEQEIKSLDRPALPDFSTKAFDRALEEYLNIKSDAIKLDDLAIALRNRSSEFGSLLRDGSLRFGLFGLFGNDKIQEEYEQLDKRVFNLVGEASTNLGLLPKEENTERRHPYWVYPWAEEDFDFAKLNLQISDFHLYEPTEDPVFGVKKYLATQIFNQHNRKVNLNQSKREITELYQAFSKKTKGQHGYLDLLEKNSEAEELKTKIAQHSLEYIIAVDKYYEEYGAFSKLDNGLASEIERVCQAHVQKMDCLWDEAEVLKKEWEQFLSCPKWRPKKKIVKKT